MVRAIRDVAGDSPVLITGDFNARMWLSRGNPRDTSVYDNFEWLGWWLGVAPTKNRNPHKKESTIDRYWWVSSFFEICGVSDCHEKLRKVCWKNASNKIGWSKMGIEPRKTLLKIYVKVIESRWFAYLTWAFPLYQVVYLSRDNKRDFHSHDSGAPVCIA